MANPTSALVSPVPATERISLLTDLVNHLSDISLTTAVSAAIGYGITKGAVLIDTAWEIDPKVGLITGAAIGALAGLFNADGSNKSSVVLMLASIAIVPYHLCRYLQLPVTVKVIAALTLPIFISLLTITTMANWAVGNKPKNN